MKILCSRLRWFACMVVLLLLCIVSSDMSQRCEELPQRTAFSSTYVSEISEGASDDAVFSSLGDDIFTYLLDTNRLGLSSSMFYMQEFTGRPLSFVNILHRTIRMVMAYIHGNIATEGQCNALCHTVASIRFHIGYFIYHRCQMRC